MLFLKYYQGKFAKKCISNYKKCNGIQQKLKNLKIVDKREKLNAIQDSENIDQTSKQVTELNSVIIPVGNGAIKKQVKLFGPNIFKNLKLNNSRITREI